MDDIISLIAEGLQLESEEKDQFAEDMKSLLDEYGIDRDVRLYDGPLYAQTNVHMHCPDCDERLTLRRPEYDGENGVTAPAKCPCGWTGRAVYRLIDLESNLRTETAEDLLDPGSCVAADELNVTYVPYGETDVTST